MDADNRVFVGGIPVRVDKKAIVDFFSQFGKVKYCKIKKNSKTGRSLGFAYLTFEDAESVAALVNRQIEFCGRICECKPVLKKEVLKDELAKEKRKKLLVYNLNPATSNLELRRYFEALTPISHAYVVKESETPLNKGYGYVVFHEESDLASFCTSKPTLTLGNRSLKYSDQFYVPPKPKKEVSLNLLTHQLSEVGKKGEAEIKRRSQRQVKTEVNCNSISEEGSEGNSSHQRRVAQFFEFPQDPFLLLSNGKMNPSSERGLRSLRTGKGVGPSSQATPTESRMEIIRTGHYGLMFDQKTGATKTTRATDDILSSQLGAGKSERKKMWQEITRISLNLNQGSSNYKFTQIYGVRPLPISPPS